MHFRVLGPLEAGASPASTRRPRGEKQRVLLALLLLHAPRAVFADTLVEALWDTAERPAHPEAALRTQLARLRSFLAECGLDAALLRREPNGILLAVPPEQLDAGRFAALRHRAGAAAQAGEPARALALLDEALALWRGAPFEDCRDHPQALGEVARLTELHGSAREQRIAALLALGRTAEAIGAAEALAHEDALRERPHALWMEALHRAGRRHQALTVFQAYRRRLAEELGLDPSPALHRLESEILRDDASGGPAVPDARSRDAAALPQPPLALAPLIGRQHELTSVRRLLGSARLVTLTGSGGSGKTRLALEIANGARDADGRAVAWVGLEAIASAEFVEQEIASALGAREHAGVSATAALRALLASRSVLLVLDNCEHLVEPCALLVDALLRGCPGLVVLATSREPLGVAGEVTWPVPPLALPDATHSQPGELARADAVQLFVDRARAVLPTFQLTDQNASAVARICRRLDGIPLALVLAAARVRALAPVEIARRLEADLGLLAGGDRAARPRHQTLRAAIDWSHQLLGAPERRLFERLSIFAGSFTLEAVEAVCADDATLPRAMVLDLLCALVDRSLVLAERDGEGTRYRLLETIRSYALERRLAADGDAALRRRHAEHFASLAEAAEPQLVSPARAATGRSLRADQENIRAALEWAVADPDGVELAYRLAGALWWFWHYVGRVGEARRWAEAVLALPPGQPSARHVARVRYTAAMACWLAGDPGAARPHGAESARLARILGEPSLLVRGLSAHAFALRDVGEMEQAKRLAAECVAVARDAGFPPTEMGFALWIQCTALLESGDVEPAEAAAREAAQLWRASGDHWGLSMVLHGLGVAELGRSAPARAAEYFREAVQLLQRDGEPYFIARSIEGLAIALVQQGDASTASRLLGAAEAIRERIGAPLLASEQARYRRTIEILVPLLETQKREDAWAEGRQLALDDVIAFVLGRQDGTRPPLPVAPA